MTKFCHDIRIPIMILVVLGNLYLQMLKPVMQQHLSSMHSSYHQEEK